MVEMKLSVLAALALLTACTSKKDFPVGGGPGGGPGGGGGPDSAVPPGDGALGDAALGDGPLALDASFYNGRVCLVADPSDLTTCANTGAGGLTVRLGTAVTTTVANGDFTIQGQASGALVWSVTGPTIVSSYKVFSDFQIPAITTAAFETLKANNLVTLVPGQGSLMATVIKNGSGRAGAVAASTPASTYEPFYDNGAASWSRTSTGTHGTVWAAGLNVGNATLTVTPPLPDGPVTSTAQPIADGGITFTTIVIP